MLALHVTVHITGPAAGASTSACFLRLSSHVVGGGSETYCLETFHGKPGPNAVVRSRGLVTFRLPHRTLRARVLVVQRFAADGKHARQTLSGTMVGGGTISGGGTDVESPPGHVTASDLRYRISVK
jgi:hypothetical protein